MLKAFALAAVLTAVAFTAYVVIVLLTEDTAGDSDELAALVIVGAFWLPVLGLLTIRTSASAIWVALGAIVGLVLSPVLALTVLLITSALFSWPVMMD